MAVSYKNNSPLINPPPDLIPKSSTTLRLVVMASGNGSNFESLVNACNSKAINAEIIGLIVNNGNCQAIKRSKRLNIPYYIYDHRNYITREEFDIDIILKIKSLRVDAIIMAGWMRLVTKQFVSTFPDRIINIHPSLLPSFKGINAIEKSFIAGSKIAGCTVHHVNEGVDSGKIIIQAAISVNVNESLNSLTKRIHKLEHIILPMGIELAAENW